MEKNDYKIGFIVDNIYLAWSQIILSSFSKSAYKADKSLFIFPGGRLNVSYNSDNLRNSVYSLVNNLNLDGLICWSSTIRDRNTKYEEFEQFHAGFAPLPYVTLGHKFPDHPCVEFDGYTGMKQLITHCIMVHGARKIAFLRGPALHLHVMDRLRAYEDALKEAGLPVTKDSPLVTDPFGWEDGEAAAMQLFEERKLIPGRDFDTIVGCNDEMASKAVNYFSRHGYHMPRDFHVLGFDNSVESRITRTPLSTVMPPYSEMASECFRLLVKLIQNGDSADHDPVEAALLPSTPVIRESCGCGDFFYRLSDPLPVSSGPGEKTLTAKIAEYLELGEKDATVFVKPLVRAWDRISQDNNSQVISPHSVDIFLHRFEKTMIQFFTSQREPALLFRLLNDVFCSGPVSASLFRKLEPAMLRIIFKVRERAAVYTQYKKDILNTELSFLKFELLETRDRYSLIEKLARHLPKIGIDTAGLVLYVDGNTSLWVGSYSPEGMNSIREQSFPAKRLVPEPLEQVYSRGIFLVQPLFVEDRYLGYFIHTVPDLEGVIFEEIRTTVSYALKGIFQVEEMVRVQQRVLESMEQSRILTLQKEAAQAASEAKSQFLANVSHEIRTPMNAVLGMSELMLSENLNSRQKQYVSDIRTSAIALLEIINQILDLSKIQSGTMNLIPVHYDFWAMMDNIGAMMRFLIKNKDIAFKTYMQSDIPRYLYGDDVRLRQVLLNLLNNAVKFTKTGSVQLSITATESEIFLTVKDTGIGIREADIPLLFEAFKQVDAVKNRETKGTGIGLSITKALVDMMNGRIEVESVYGQGSSFHVVIPKVLGDETQVEQSVSGKNIVCPKDTKILVVDDNTINLNVITGLLRLSNVAVSTAMSGRQAIEMIQHNKYSLVFMDHMMPEMDGVEAMKIIREMTTNVPIVALTANAVTSAKEMLLAAGMDDFLSKPIVKEELNGILVKWIPGSRHNDPRDDTPLVVDGGHNMEKAFRENIGKIEGLSAQTGLERVSGQMDVYQDALKLLVKEIEKCVRKLGDFMAADDMDNFAIEAHSMKSSLANVGAMELSGVAYDLESASSRGDKGFCASNLQSFSDKLRELGLKLKDAFSGLNQDDGPVLISPDLALILTRINDSIEEMKFEEINIELENLESLRLSGKLKDEIEAIKDEIMVMEYGSATEKIRMALDNYFRED